jgi:hypothetical protein
VLSISSVFVEDATEVVVETEVEVCVTLMIMDEVLVSVLC